MLLHKFIFERLSWNGDSIALRMMMSRSHYSNIMTTTATTKSTKTRIGIMASHEQVNATDLLSDVISMEQSGLERCWVSDHYMPWWHDGLLVS